MSQAPSKSFQKMCKSPKSAPFQMKQEKIDYENMSTNCTVVGSNNLNLVKKPQLVTSMSPVYSNPSPSYPQSPYSSPASLKSPSPILKPPTPQPNFNVMQIIHNNHLITRPIQTSQPQNIIKLKPHLNILPKPSASPQPSPKPSVSPQIVLPTGNQTSAATASATLLPTHQPLLLNQMPMLAAPGVQFILRPQATTHMTTAGPKLQATSQAHQGLILQPTCGTQHLLQLGTPRSQPMVRVLANGVQLAPSTTTYVTTQMANQPINASNIQQTIINNTHHHHQQQHQQQQIHIQQQQQVIKKKPKAKVKKKLDLANIMKLSGIGDDDGDIQYDNVESDTSESEHNSVPTTPQPPSMETKKNIQINALPQQTINATAPVVQVLNQNFQSGMISNNTSQAAAAAAAAAAQAAGGGIPFNSTFITPNFTINNGLMLQRSSGGFKLTVGEDGRLVLQHDPALNQDLQSQLLLQSLLGLNGGLVLQPSMDQQTVQQTVQTIQQQSVQTIQQQTVQSQTIQTVQQQTVQPQVQHTIQVDRRNEIGSVGLETMPIPMPMSSNSSTDSNNLKSLQPQIQQQTVQQTIQHQTVNALQQPMQIVQPQPIHSLHSVQPGVHSISQSQVHNLQSQIQSLLQQQNVAVQAQTVHQNVPQNVQAIQNLTQNVQNLAQSSMQVAQNLATAQSSSVQNVNQSSVVSQNMSQSASMQNVVAQNMAQTTAIQNVNMSQNVQGMSTTAQAPPLQSSVQSVQGFQQAHTQTTQPVLKVQPFQKAQPPVQTVQPIQQHQQQNVSENLPPNNPTSYVVNLTPEQLEQLKRNGQVTVNGQTIFMQRPNKDQNEKKLSPKTKPVKKMHKIQGIKSMLHEHSPTDERKVCLGPEPQIKSKPMSSPVGTTPQLPPPPSVKPHMVPHNHVQPMQNKSQQPQAMVQPSVQHQVKMERQKSPMSSPKQHKVSPTVHLQDSNGANVIQDVDKLLGQILEESGAGVNSNNHNNHTIERQPQQRITTIQLTPQKQQHLKNIQMQIQTLSARLQPGDTELHSALKALFAEQQKILASGKLLPPDKVYYLNNQLTIVNPSLNLPSPASSVKSEPPSPGLGTPTSGGGSHQTTPRSSSVENTTAVTIPATTTHPPISSVSNVASPRISVSTSTGDLVSSSSPVIHSTIHHHPTPSQHHHHHHHQVPVVNHYHHQPVVSHSNHVAGGQKTSSLSCQLPTIYPKPSQQQQLHSPQQQQQQQQQLPSPQPTQPISIHQQQQQHHIVAAHAQQTQPVTSQASKSKLPSPNAQQPHLKQQQQQHGIVQHAQQLLIQQQQQQLHQQHLLTQQHSVAVQQQQQQQQQQHQAQKQSNAHQQQQLSLAKKAHLIESQLTLDQQGASKPDVHRPFKDKRDACSRLIRYHCLDQPPITSQNLSKADEVFEMSALHVISKYDKMIDKYKYLLMKESTRQVQTSELMMLDRMFLADEQQSLIRLRQDYETELFNLVAEQQQLPASPSGEAKQEKNGGQTEGDSAGEEYDEWACIQRELGCLPAEAKEALNSASNHHNNHYHAVSNSGQPPLPVSNQSASVNNLKRTSSSDSRLETLKRFRVDKHTKRHDHHPTMMVNSNNNNNCGSSGSVVVQCTSSSSQMSASPSDRNCSGGDYESSKEENTSIDEQVQSAINSILNLQQSTAQQQQQGSSGLDLDSILS